MNCPNCEGTGIEPNIGGLCVKCAGTGARRPGRDPLPSTRADIIHCLCGHLLRYCPAADGQRCWPRPVA